MRRRDLILILSGLAIAAAAPAGGAERAFRIAEVRALSLEMQREFAALQYVMTASEQREFLRLPDLEARRDFVRRFWVAHDPEPTLPGNRMREDHYDRVALAREQFGHNVWPGWDTRGEILIRHGPPDYTGHVQGEVSNLRFRPPAELWYYKPHNMLVAFEDFEGKGHYKLALSSSGPGRYITPQLVEFLLLDENPSYEGLIPANLLDENYVRPERRRSTVEIQHLMKKGRDMAGNTHQVFEENLSTYSFNFEEERRFPFFFDSSRFKAGADRTRLDVACEFIVEPDEEHPGERTIVAAATVFDERFREVDAMSHEVRVDASRASDSRLIPLQLTTTVGVGRYRVAVSLLEEETDRYSAFWTDVECGAFGDTLAVSDILFAQRIGEPSGDSPFVRGPVEVVPHPVRRYVMGRSLPVYFEIYGLVPDDVGRTRYEIEYRIVPRTGSKQSFWDRFHGLPPAVSSRFQGSGDGTDERLHFTVRTEHVQPGLYDFLISVTDTWSQSTASREASFRIQQGAITLDEFKE